MFSRHGSGVGVVPVVKRVCADLPTVHKTTVHKMKDRGCAVEPDCRPWGDGSMRNAQRFFAPVFVILALFFASSFSFADVTGSILGVVRDPSQAVVKGVRVTVTNTQTNLSQDA